MIVAAVSLLVVLVVIAVVARSRAAESSLRDLRYATADNVILVLVADQTLQRRMLEILNEKYRVAIANTALEAGVLMRAFRYRLVIVSNLGMPPGHAVSVVPNDHAYPVIFISGVWDDDLRRACREKRLRCMDAPFTMDALRKTVGRRVGRDPGPVSFFRIIPPAVIRNIPPPPAVST